MGCLLSFSFSGENHLLLSFCAPFLLLVKLSFSVKKCLYIAYTIITFLFLTFILLLPAQGVQPLLDGVLNYLPCPIEVSNFALDQKKNEKKVPIR